MKKITLLFICLVNVLNISAKVYSGSCGDNVRYSLDTETGVLSITGSGAMESYSSSIYVPWYYNTSYIKTVMIATGITSIGDYAFYNCPGLTSVTIPNSVTCIGEGVFRNTNLITLIVGSGVQSIASNALSTKPIKTIWLTNTPPQNYTVAQGIVNYVANSLYSSISNKKEYKFLSSMFEADGVRYVPVSPSDRTCDAIDCIYEDSSTEININSTVVYKGVSMKVQNIQPYTFYQNNLLQKINFGIAGNIGKYVCYGCKNLQTAVLGENVTGIGESAFNGCSKLDGITVPESVDTIGQYAFSNCSGIISVNIGAGPNTIGDYVFSGCSSLSSVNIGVGTNTIGNYVFSGCTNLESISLGEGTVTIGNCVFSDCSKLSSITVPSSMNSIGNYAFRGCTSLKTIIIANRQSEGDLKFGYNGSNPLFVDCPLDSVYIGRNISYSTSSSYGYSPFYRNTSLRSVTVTDKETEISDNEFYGCTNLQNVQIGDGVTSIGNWAFSGCSSLKNFSFGTQVQTIGKEAFSDCNAVTAITSKAENPPVCGSMALDDINKWECKLYVPEGHVADYQAADQWKEFFFVEEGEEGSSTPVDPSGNKCATPTIEYVDGKLTFDCDTEAVEYVSSITPPSAFNSDNKTLSVPTTYKVTVYATKSGYENSDVATKEINISGLGGIRGDVNFDNEVGMPDVMFIVNYILNGKFPDEK